MAKLTSDDAAKFTISVGGQSIEIRIVAVANATVGLNNKTTPWSTSNPVTLLYDKDATDNEYTIETKNVTYINKIDEIELDLDISGYIHTHTNDCCGHYDKSKCTEDCYTCTDGKDCLHKSKGGDKNITSEYTGKKSNNYEYYQCPMCEHWGDMSHYCYYKDAAKHYHQNTDCKDTMCQYGLVDGKFGTKDLKSHTHSAACCGHTHLKAENNDGLQCSHVAAIEADTIKHTADCLKCEYKYVNGTDATCTGGTITTTGEISKDSLAKISVTVDNITLDLFDIVVIDTSNLPVVLNNVVDPNNFYVGNQNALSFDDLFKVRNKGTDTSNYVIKIFDSIEGRTDYMYATGGTELADSGAFCVTKNDDGTFQFTGTSGNSPVTIAVYEKLNDGTYERRSPDITVNVVDAVNVRSWDEISKMLVKTKHSDSADYYNYILNSQWKGIVMLNDIQMAGGSMYLKNQTLWGNLCTLYITKGQTQHGIIRLNNSKIYDAKIVGDVYTTFALRVDDEYGSAAVYTIGGTCYLENCYIANCRSPLAVGAATTVRNCVFYGGRYCNIDHRTATTLTLEGDITTVQEVITVTTSGLLGTDTKKVIGLGICTWFDDNQHTIKFGEYTDPTNPTETVKTNLVQYNFIEKDLADDLPVLSYEIANVDIPLIYVNNMFNEIFEQSNKYGDYIFTNDTDQYINSGIAALDKHYIDFVEPKTSTWDSWGGKKTGWMSGDELQIKLVATGDDENAKITFTYDTSKYNYKSSVIPQRTGKATDNEGNETEIKVDKGTITQSGGSVTYEGTINTGDQITIVLTFKNDKTENLGSGFGLDYSGNALCHTVLQDSKGDAIKTFGDYGNITYSYGFGKMTDAIKGAFDATNSFHSSGLHYTDKIEISVISPLKDKESNQKLLEDYIAHASDYNTDYELTYRR